MPFTALSISPTPPPTAATDGGPVAWGIGIGLVLVVFGIMVWRTLRRNRLRK